MKLGVECALEPFHKYTQRTLAERVVQECAAFAWSQRADLVVSHAAAVEAIDTRAGRWACRHQRDLR